MYPQDSSAMMLFRSVFVIPSSVLNRILFIRVEGYLEAAEDSIRSSRVPDLKAAEISLLSSPSFTSGVYFSLSGPIVLSR